MDNLPQLHDWFAGLLTTNQWLFAWIIGWAVFLALTLWLISSDGGWSEGEVGALIVIMPFLAPLLIWGVIMVILNFLSFMIYLLNT